MWSRTEADVGKKGLVVDCKARQVENGLKAQRGDFVRVNALLFGELEAGTLLAQRTLHAPTIRARRVFDWRRQVCMEGCWCTRPSPWCAVLHKHTQIHDNPLHGLSKAMNGGHSAYSPCKSGSQRDSVAAVIKESPLFRCLSTFQSFPTRLRHTRWTTSQQIWRQFEIFCMETAKGIKSLGCRSQ